VGAAERSGASAIGPHRADKNLDLQIAAANIEEFQAQLMIAKFNLVPSLFYSGRLSLSRRAGQLP
jgi:outer membrane protein TolC